MVKSMTGYGVVKTENEDFSLLIEIRTLNSKFFDFNMKVPRTFNQFEIDFRNILVNKLVRGKVNVEIELTPKTKPLSEVTYNEELFRYYYGHLKKLADGVMAPYDELFKLAIQSPDVMLATTSDEYVMKAKEFVVEGLAAACNQCDQFRKKEGEVLQGSLVQYIHAIKSNLDEIESLDNLRIDKIRDRIKENAEAFLSQINLDQNRFEQEILYYIEKLDISEEKVRLKSHLDHFLEVINAEESNGKKLGFISQEMGREINTIGAKANDAGIQKIVVCMKDELEKIKEQVANIL